VSLRSCAPSARGAPRQTRCRSELGGDRPQRPAGHQPVIRLLDVAVVESHAPPPSITDATTSATASIGKRAQPFSAGKWKTPTRSAARSDPRAVRAWFFSSRRNARQGGVAATHKETRPVPRLPVRPSPERLKTHLRGGSYRGRLLALSDNPRAWCARVGSTRTLRDRKRLVGESVDGCESTTTKSILLSVPGLSKTTDVRWRDSSKALVRTSDHCGAARVWR